MGVGQVEGGRRQTPQASAQCWGRFSRLGQDDEICTFVKGGGGGLE